MEYLDIYDENMNFIGKEERGIVHDKGYWHKTMGCWLYDKLGNVYMQIRKEENKLFSASSGHVLAGETVEQSVQREIFEEIGLKIDINKLNFIQVVKWKQEKIKNGKDYKDRIFSYAYNYCLDNDNVKFNFDENEVRGIVKIDAKQCLDLVYGKLDKINAIKITNNGTEQIQITQSDFLFNQNEKIETKYGPSLQLIVDSLKQ